jgi:exopolysaccharide biosynthesis polyprenyl glycosylphosphotransferase
VIARRLLGQGVTSYTWLLPLTLGALALAHAYRPRLTLSVLQDSPLLITSLLGALTAYYLVVSPDQAIIALLGEALALLVVIAAMRAGTYAVIRIARIQESVGHPTVLLGNDALTWKLADILATHHEFGLRPVGVIENGEPRAHDSRVPWLGGYDRLPGLLLDGQVTHIIVTTGTAGEDELVETLRNLAAAHCTVFVVPRLHELWDRPYQCDEVWGVPMLRMRRSPDRTMARRIKRALDIAVAAAGLLLLSPLLGLIALAVRIELGRGVLFRQTRIGQHGRPFVLLKFRSLRPADPHEAAVQWNIDQDPRLGPVGRILRMSGLDELPQLWNVLRGDMSLVGPRPERPYFVDRFGSSIPRYLARHRVPVGLTGWAQVHGLRGPTSIEERIRFDNNYIQRWSIWVDLTILLRTVSHLAVGMLRPGAAPTRDAELELGSRPASPLDIEEPVAVVPDRVPSRPLRVLHVAQPTEGGVARCVLQDIAAAAGRGWKVALAVPFGPLAEDAGACGAEVFHWDARRSPGPTVPAEVRALRRIVAAWGPDVVHLHSSKAGLAGRLAVRGRVPTLFQPHAWSFDAITGPLRAASLLWERWAHRWADLVVCVSEDERAEGCRAEIHARYAVATNGVDLTEFPLADDAARDRARRDLGLADVPTVVCAGRLCRQKGQDVLLDAWPAVLAEVPTALLVLVGDGPERQQLRVPARTVFAGHADRVQPWLAAADVVALPSRWEGHPLVLLEAMATGRVVVATQVTGVAETLDGSAGELVPVEDPKALAAALVRRLTNARDSEHEIISGRIRVEKAFDLSTTVPRLLDLTRHVAVRELGLPADVAERV